MKTIYLHIGTHKTGSTSIQRFLARADKALAERGILYPEVGRPETDWSDQYGQHRLYWALVGKRGVESDQVWHDLMEEIDAFSGHSVVLSAEGFDGIGKGDIWRVLNHVSPHPVRVVVYLRSPLQYLKSAFNQRVKMGTYRRPFIRFVEERAPDCNYRDLVGRWDRFDGIEAVDIRLFDKVKRTPGLEASFADAIGIGFEELQSFSGPPINSSPSDKLTQIARWINQFGSLGSEGRTLERVAGRARNNVLGRRWPGRWLVRALRPFVRSSLATDRAAARLQDKIGDSHRRFLKTYIPPEDRAYLQL